eukprot:TRINITY_DN8127_c0_g1_i3.p1 TRINITY_DN8127_c0_g1~~TRINITY_DN8127_c0_g1_i3.p1  ORF type:complete len:697 (+),score=185.74 TRINITY_DN8127_c0_g1_i3:205-2295(+)
MSKLWRICLSSLILQIICMLVSIEKMDNRLPITFLLFCGSCATSHLIWVKDLLLNTWKTVYERSKKIQLKQSKKNMIRHKIQQFFKQRDAFCLVRPLNEESKLSHIEDQKWEELRPQFREGVDLLMKKIRGYVKPKVINGTALTGSMFLHLVLEYISSINSGGVPVILSSFERVMASEARRIFDELTNEFTERSAAELSETNLPMEQDDLRTAHRRIATEAIYKLERMVVEKVDTVTAGELRRELEKLIESDFSAKEQLNDKLSAMICNDLVNKFINSFNVPPLKDSADLNETAVLNVVESMNHFRLNYLKFARGKFKYDSLANKFLDFVLERFKGLFQSMVVVFQTESTRMSEKLKEAREGERRLRETLKEMDGQLYSVLRDRDELKIRVEQFEREFNKKISQKEQLIKSQTDDYEFRMKKKKDKLAQQKKEIEDLQAELENVRGELLERKKQQLALERQLKEGGGSRMTSSGLLNDTREEELHGIIAELKEEINTLRSNMKIGSNPETLRKIRVEQEKIVSKLLDEQAVEKSAFEEKLRVTKEQYENRYKELKDQYKIVCKEKEALLLRDVESETHKEMLSTRESRLQELSEELTGVKRRMVEKDDMVNTCREMIEAHNKDIEQRDRIIQELEERLSRVTSEVARLKSAKDEYVYFFREYTLKVRGKPNSYEVAKMMMSEDDLQQLEDIIGERV